MTSRFRYRLFTLPFDQEAFEALMQDILIDDKKGHEIVSESSHWTKEGEHMVAVSFIEKSTDESDLY